MPGVHCAAHVSSISSIVLLEHILQVVVRGFTALTSGLVRAADLEISSLFLFVGISKMEKINNSLLINLSLCGRPVRALSLVSKDSEFNSSAKPSVVKIAIQC